MALTATVSKFASCNVPVDGRRERKSRTTTGLMEIGRRGLLLSSTVIAASQVNDSKTELLNRYRKKSEENKAKNDKERLDSYYKRNYKDYFGLLGGSLKGKEELSESEKGILDWLESNK